MKLLKILICSLLILLFNNSFSKAQSFSTRLGVYQFSDITASEFYFFAPTLLCDYDIWRISQMSLQITTGFSYNQIKYNSHHHYLYMIPVLVSVNYDLPNPGARIYPVIGVGLTFIDKIDKNKDLQKTYYSLFYGYHITGKIVYKLNGKVNLTFDLTYNLMIPPSNEELNINGFIIAAGINLPIKSDKSKTNSQPEHPR